MVGRGFFSGIITMNMQQLLSPDSTSWIFFSSSFVHFKKTALRSLC
jgi:hypothetical protein